MGPAPPSDTTLAAGEAAPMATDDPPAVPVLSADTVLAGSASAAAEVLPVVADDMLATADDPSTTAHTAP